MTRGSLQSAGCAIVLVMAVTAAAAAAPASTYNTAAARGAEQRVMQLRALQRLTVKAGAEAAALGEAALRLRSALAEAQQSGNEAQASGERAENCLPQLQAAADEQAARLAAAEAAQSKSRAAVAAMNQAPASGLATLAQRADGAFADRRNAEAALQHSADAWRSTLRTCQARTAVSDRDLRQSAGAVLVLRRQAAALPAQSRAVRTIWFDAKAGATSAAERGWMSAAAVARVRATLNDASIEALSRSVQSPPMSPSISGGQRVASLSPSIVDVWVPADERAKLADASAMADALAADCGTVVADVSADTSAMSGCARLAAQRAELRVRAVALSEALGNSITRASQIVSSQREHVARQRESHTAAAAELAALAAVAEPAVDAALRIADEAQGAAQQLRAQVEPAVRLAIRQARAAGVGGLPASSGGEAAGAPPPLAPPSPVTIVRGPMAAPLRPLLTGHAWEFFRALNGEREGFGAYTYVLLRSASDLQQPSVLRRYSRVLDVVQRERSAAAVAGTEAPFVNLFCIPGQDGGSTPQLLAQGYDDDLSLQLLFRAQSGLLTRPEMKRRLRDSTGPFLLTLPVRIGDATSSTPLLFADLSRYPDDAIADLVNQYKGSLLTDFPDQQAAWKPPVPQRVALVMIGLASDVGSLVMSVIPAALAGER